MKDFNSLDSYSGSARIFSFLNNKMLPSYSFGAEGVEYGRKAPFYVPSSGPLNLPSDLEVKGNLRVDGGTTLVGPASVGGPFSVGTGGVTTSGSLITGSTLVPGGSIFGYDGSATRAPNFPSGLASQASVVVNQGSVTVTQGATGGIPGLLVTNAGIGGNPVRTVSVFNDQASPGTLISMQNGTDSGTLAYTGTAFQLSRPLTIPVQAGSSGNLTVGGDVSAHLLNVGTGGVSTSGSLVTGSTLAPGGSIYGYNGSSVVPPKFPLGLLRTTPATTTAFGGVIPYTFTGEPIMHYGQGAQVNITVPNDWHTNLSLPLGLMMTHLNYAVGGAGNTVIYQADGTELLQAGSIVSPSITNVYFARNGPGTGNCITIAFSANGGGIGLRTTSAT